MRVKVYNEIKPEPQKTLNLRLVEKDNGNVALHAVDDDGDTLLAGRLLLITTEGRLELIGCVNTDLGLDLDSEERLVPHL